MGEFTGVEGQWWVCEAQHGGVSRRRSLPCLLLSCPTWGSVLGDFSIRASSLGKRAEALWKGFGTSGDTLHSFCMPSRSGWGRSDKQGIFILKFSYAASVKTTAVPGEAREGQTHQAAPSTANYTREKLVFRVILLIPSFLIYRTQQEFSPTWVKKQKQNKIKVKTYELQSTMWPWR